MTGSELETRVTGDRQRPAPLHGSGLEPGRIVGRYELLQKLGHGGMATVYLGRATGTAGFAKRVAIKVIHPHLATEAEFVEMFLDEARLAAELHHPNVVDTLDLGQDGDNYYTVLELIEGDSLAGLLGALDGEPLPLDVILTILIDGCAGLDAAHELTDADGAGRDLVHRDVSPQNLLVNLDGWVKVTDFGIAKAVGRATHTRPGQLRGKLQYMSPEQARGEPIDRRADLFAIGLIGYEMLTGKRPFTGDTAANSLRRVLECDIPTLSPDGLHYEGARLSPASAKKLCEIFDRALAADVDGRFATADAFAAALTEVLSVVDGGGENPRRKLGRIMRRFFQGRVDYMHAQLREGNERSAVAMSTALVNGRSDLEGSSSARMAPPSGVGMGVGAVTGLTSEFPAAASSSMVGQRRGTGSLGVAMLVALTAVVVMTIAVTRNVSQTRTDATPTNPATAGALPAAAAKTVTAQVRWYISSDPDGASIRIDGAMQPELTPATITLPRSQTPVEVLLEAGVPGGPHTPRARGGPEFPYQLRPLPSAAQRLTLPTRPAAEEGRTLSPRPRSSGRKRAASRWRQGPKDAALRARRPEEGRGPGAPKQVLQADA